MKDKEDTWSLMGWLQSSQAIAGGGLNNGDTTGDAKWMDGLGMFRGNHAGLLGCTLRVRKGRKSKMVPGVCLLLLEKLTGCHAIFL